MKIFKKTLIYSSIFIFVVIIAGFIFVQEAKKEGPFRETSLYWAKKIKNFVYYQATIHNPEGDRLPDQIDDNIILEAKKILN